jgi:hypothetical protein
MSFFHAMISIDLIALVAGVALLIYIKNQDKVKSFWPIFVAWFVVVLSSVSILCSFYHSIKYRDDFILHRTYMEKMMKQSLDENAMQKGMDNQMMQKGMEKSGMQKNMPEMQKPMK